MSKYFDDECRQCNDYIEPYGCTNKECPIRIDYEECRASMAADDELERRKDTGLGL